MALLTAYCRLAGVLCLHPWCRGPPDCLLPPRWGPLPAPLVLRPSWPTLHPLCGLLCWPPAPLPLSAAGSWPDSHSSVTTGFGAAGGAFGWACCTALAGITDSRWARLLDGSYFPPPFSTSITSRLAATLVALVMRWTPSPAYKPVKKFIDFPVPSRDVTDQTLPGREKINYSRPGRVWSVIAYLGTGK
jgi:hypothetical protein